MFLNKNYLIINDRIIMHIKCVLSLLMRLSIYFPFVIVKGSFLKLSFFNIYYFGKYMSFIELKSFLYQLEG